MDNFYGKGKAFGTACREIREEKEKKDQERHRVFAEAIEEQQKANKEFDRLMKESDERLKALFDEEIVSDEEEKETEEEYTIPGEWALEKWTDLTMKYPLQKDGKGVIISGLEYIGGGSRIYTLKYYENGQWIYAKDFDRQYQRVTTKRALEIFETELEQELLRLINNEENRR